MPKSLAFEVYLMNLLLEQNMNQVNKKSVVADDEPVPVGRNQQRPRPAGQARGISSISAPRQAPR